jgi:protein TonB
MITEIQHPSRTRYAAWLAAVLTLVIFTALPLAESLRRGSQDPLRLYELTRVELPPPPVHARVQEERPTRSQAPKPELESPRERIPLSAVLSMDVAMQDFAGDFDIQFTVDAPDLLGAGTYVFEIAEIDQAPMPLARFNPPYPPRARMRRIEGEVQLEFVVSRDGDVRDAVVTSANPQGVFEAAALRAVEQWRFKPGTNGGEAVPVRVRQSIRFALER